MTTGPAYLRLAPLALALAATSGCMDWSRFHARVDAAATDDSIDANPGDDATSDIVDLHAPDGDARDTDPLDSDVADVAAEAACNNSGPPDYCASIPSLPTAPTLDGTLECGLALQRFTAADYYVSTGPLPATVVTSFAVAWRPQGLYVYAQLEGANDDPAIGTEGAYCGDSLEIFVDHDGVNRNLPMYDASGTRQFVIAVPPRAATAGTQAEIYRDRVLLSSWSTTQWVSVRSGSMVRFEALIVGRDLGVATWTLAAAQHVGFDLGITLGTGTVSDAGSCRHTLGRFVLRLAPGDGGCVQPSCSPLAFCTPILAP